MLLANKVRLQPNKEQERAFRRFCDTTRFMWNESKSFYDSLYKETGEYANQKTLIKHYQDLKHNNPEYEWLKDTPEAVVKQAIKDLLKGYQKFYSDRKNSKFDPIHPDKYKPKYKKKGKCTESFYQRTDNLHKFDDIHIKITGVKTPVKCTALRGVNLPEHPQNPRVTYDGKYWYLAYSYEIEDNPITDFEREYLGIDLGIKDFAVTSEGKHYRNINRDREVRRLRKRLRRLQRQVSRKYEANCTTDGKGNKIYHKTSNIRKLEQQIRMIYRRIHNIQKTYMYEVVKDVVRTKPRHIVLEDLNVKGMMQNPRLARAIQEENLSEFRRILTYKCEKLDMGLIIADRWYPSSKRCSECGNIKATLKLSERTYKCEYCGLKIDRDENAAVNLEQYPRLSYKAA